MKKSLYFFFFLVNGLFATTHLKNPVMALDSGMQIKKGFTASSVVPTRSQIPIADTWDLTPLFENDAAWEVAYNNFKATYPSITSYSGLVGSSAQELFDTLQDQNQLDQSLNDLYEYASLSVSVNGGDMAALDRQQRCEVLMSQYDQACSFINSEIEAATFDTYLASPI